MKNEIEIQALLAEARRLAEKAINTLDAAFKAHTEKRSQEEAA